MRGSDCMDDFFGLVKLCGLLMEGAMTGEEKREMLRRDYHELVPCKWQQELLATPWLSEDGELYRMFWRAGIFDADEMTEIVLQYWYLQHRTL